MLFTKKSSTNGEDNRHSSKFRNSPELVHLMPAVEQQQAENMERFGCSYLFDVSTSQHQPLNEENEDNDDDDGLAEPQENEQDISDGEMEDYLDDMIPDLIELNMQVLDSDEPESDQEDEILPPSHFIRGVPKPIGTRAEVSKFIELYQELMNLPRHLTRSAVVKLTDNWNTFVLNELDGGNEGILERYRFKTQYHIKEFKDKFEKRIRQIMWLDDNAEIIARLRNTLRQNSDTTAFLNALPRQANAVRDIPSTFERTIVDNAMNDIRSSASLNYTQVEPDILDVSVLDAVDAPPADDIIPPDEHLLAEYPIPEMPDQSNRDQRNIPPI